MTRKCAYGRQRAIRAIQRLPIRPNLSMMAYSSVTAALSVTNYNPGPSSTFTPNQASQLTAPVDPVLTYSQLPNDYRTLPGSLGFCSDAGLCIWNGTNWVTVNGGGIFTPQTLTSAGINAAAVTASQAGGGTVLLPAQTITLTAPIIMQPNVAFQGAGWQTSTQLSILVAGTILQGNGTFDCFDYNNVDLAAPYSTAAQLTGSLLQGPTIQNLAITNFQYGIKCGAQYQGGCQWGFFNNIYVSACTQWGVYFENYSQCIFQRMYITANNHGAWFRGSGTNLNNLGNSNFYKINAGSSTANGAGRAFYLSARQGSNSPGAGSQTNSCSLYDVNGGGGPVTSTQAATMFAPIACTITNLSASISVTNTFSAGDPVTFSVAVGTGAGGVAVNTLYYVSATGLSTSAAQVSATLGGTPITFNASGTPNIQPNKIGLTDMSKVGVGMYVRTTTNTNGFNNLIGYFVTSVSAATGAGFVTLSQSMGGTGGQVPRAPTGNAAVNIVINGWQQIEIGAEDPGSSIQYIAMKGAIDSEGALSPHLVLQGVEGSDIECGLVSASGQFFQVVYRNCVVNGSQLSLMQPGYNLDVDSSSKFLMLRGAVVPFRQYQHRIG